MKRVFESNHHCYTHPTYHNAQTNPVVYVPNAPVLTEREVALFNKYVYSGGNLLVMGLTSCYDRYGQLQDGCILEGILGARLVNCFVEHQDNYIRLPKELAKSRGGFLLKDITTDWPMLSWGPIAIFEAKGAQAFGELIVAYRSQDNPWMHHMSPEKVVGPVVLLNQHGRAR